MSQTLFEIVTHVTRDSCRAQARAHSGRRNRTAWILCALMAAGVAVLWAVGSKFADWLTVLLGILLMQMLLQSETLGWRLYSARNKEAHEVRLTFADSAPGVSDDQLQKLFERFYRTEGSRNRASGGSGLGLAICLNIVEAHNGRIIAAHSPFGGVSITVELPLERDLQREV